MSIKYGFFVPIYSRAGYVHRLSKIPNVHFIDDGSDDDTLDLIKKSGKPYITSETNKGKTHSHNQALEWAETLQMDAMNIMHSDDYPILDSVNHQEIFEDCVRVGNLVATGFMGAKGGLVYKYQTLTAKVDNHLHPAKDGWIWGMYAKGISSFGGPPMWYLPRRLFNHRFTDEFDAYQDVDFFCTIAQQNPIFYKSCLSVQINHDAPFRKCTSPDRTMSTLSEERTRLFDKYRTYTEEFG